jgi:GNAT superfamily N-acetyltransferase
MIKIVRTNSNDSDFIFLIKQLDAYLNNKPVVCGAFKKFDKNSVEIKRMFTLPENRSKGIASKILNVLKVWAKESGFNSCILETGNRQVEAVNFYKKNACKIIPNFRQYKNIDNSLCFKKVLK